MTHAPGRCEPKPSRARSGPPRERADRRLETRALRSLAQGVDWLESSRS
jgi:hypothetical protein